MTRRSQKPSEAVDANMVERIICRGSRRFNHDRIMSSTSLGLSRAISSIFVVALLAGCGEPMYDNAGSPNSLLEDREACAMEMEKSSAAVAYRRNPTAHPEYVSQVFEDMNRCIERKGWKQVRSPQEQERLSEVVTSELAHGSQPMGLSDPKAREALTRAVEDRLARPSNSVQSATRSDWRER